MSTERWHDLFIMAPLSERNIQVNLKVDVLEAGKMGKCTEVSKFDMGQIVMARWSGQSIS